MSCLLKLTTNQNVQRMTIDYSGWDRVVDTRQTSHKSKAVECTLTNPTLVYCPLGDLCAYCTSCKVTKTLSFVSILNILDISINVIALKLHFVRYCQDFNDFFPSRQPPYLFTKLAKGCLLKDTSR